MHVQTEGHVVHHYYSSPSFWRVSQKLPLISEQFLGRSQPDILVQSSVLNYRLKNVQKRMDCLTEVSLARSWVVPADRNEAGLLDCGPGAPGCRLPGVDDRWTDRGELRPVAAWWLAAPPFTRVGPSDDVGVEPARLETFDTLALRGVGVVRPADCDPRRLGVVDAENTHHQHRYILLPSTSTQPSIPPGMMASFNWESKGRFIPFVDKQVGEQVRLRSIDNACHTWALL